jgi:hypothetical protein
MEILAIFLLVIAFLGSLQFSGISLLPSSSSEQKGGRARINLKTIAVLFFVIWGISVMV